MSMVVYTRNLSTGHMESEGSEVEGHAQQHNKSRLAYMRPCLKKNETASSVAHTFSPSTWETEASGFL